VFYRIPLRIVFYPEGDSIIAHCLELDLAGEGADRGAAAQSLRAAMETQIAWSAENNDISLLLSPAPRELEVMFAAGQDVDASECGFAAPDETTSFRFEPPRVRSFAGPLATTLHAATA